jgi:hypothetical protein
MKTISNDMSELDKDIQEMTRENTQWIKNLFYVKEEIHFLKTFLKSDIFKKYKSEIGNALNLFSDKLDELNTQHKELSLSLYKHQKDIQGLRECDDINCETFYHEFHTNREISVEGFMENYNSIKKDLYTLVLTYL